MKKILCYMSALVLMISLLPMGALAAVSATPNAARVLVNGKSVAFEAYTIHGNNYFKLRDLAMALNGTEKQFEVGWDGPNNAIGITTGRAYTPVGGELAPSGGTGVPSAELTSSRVFINGVQANLTAYRIGGNNYFKLRDVGAAMNFGVDWNGSANLIAIDTAIKYTPEVKNLVVHYIDVGQADATFIELSNGQTMLIDAGNSENGPQIVNYLKGLGYYKITYLVATHPHADHIGGMAYVVNQMGIGSVYMPKAVATTQTYEELLTAIQTKGLGVLTAKAGVSILDTDSLNMKMLAPNKEQYRDLNNHSAVIQITNQKNTFLFMGDAEELSENEITDNPAADVLKVGHHGSNSSTGAAFLKKVQPKYAVISVGTGNDYGHPAQGTLDRLAAIGATVYRTDRDGTIVLTSDGTTITANKNGSTGTGSEPGGNSSPSPSTNEVIISNVDKAGELVTIKNTGTIDRNLQGWVLVSVTGNQRYTFPSYTLKAGGSVKVASGDASGDLKWTSGNMWNNSSSDPAQLYDSAGNLMSSFGG